MTELPFDVKSEISPTDAKETFYIAKGTRNLGKAQNANVTWSGLVKRLSKPTVTGESFKKFLSQPKEEQDRLKNVDGWWIGAFCEGGRRGNKSIHARRIVTFDMDDCPPGVLADLTERRTGIAPYTFVVHSTRKHTAEKPRLRITFLLDDEIAAEKYMPLCRILGQKLDPTLDMIDDVSFRLAQMMFWPSRSKDSEFFFYYNSGVQLDAQKLLADFGDWEDFTKLPFSEKQGQKRPSDAKAENPRTKKGIVGAFCRAYSVEEAIDKFLPDIYAPGDEDSGKPRYTFLLGSTTNGVVVEDDGDFIYSHHSTDPCGELLCNAFDMVRLHLYADEDKESDLDATPGKRPSFKLMVELGEEDQDVIKELAADRYDMAAMFDDSDLDGFEEEERQSIEEHVGSRVDTDPPEYEDLDDEAMAMLGGASHPLDKFRGTKLKRAKKGWLASDLEFDGNGAIVNSMNNISQIVTNDDRLHGAVAFDDFAKRVVLRRDITSKIKVIPPLTVNDRVNGDRWQDNFDIRLRALLEYPNGKNKPGYGLKVTDRDLVAGISLASSRNTFHPVRDMLLEAENTPYTPGSVETLFIRYLGCPDTPYYREVAKVVMLASVTRIMEPGCKFDHSPVLEGPQGVRKSTFIEILYGRSFAGELTCKLNDVQEIAENIAGKWAMEFPELSSFYKSDHNDAKAFLSRGSDDVRMAYDRRVSTFPRQTVFWGTTNDEKYLKDPTGNRRWWILHVLAGIIDTDALEQERGSLWAEALAMYVAARTAQPYGDLHLDLRDPLSQAEAKRLQESARVNDLSDQWAESITDWLETPIRLSTLKIQHMPDNDADSSINDEVNRMGDFLSDEDDENTWVLRCAVRQQDILVYALGKTENITTSNDMTMLNRAMGVVGEWPHEREIRPVKGATRKFGILARWRVQRSATECETRQGYREIEAPSADDGEYGEGIEDLL